MGQVVEVPADVGYARWAPAYDRETAVSWIENKLVRKLTPPLREKRLLDVGCGNGRRIFAAAARSAAGVEPCLEMREAAAGLGSSRPDIAILDGNVCDLPVPDGSFDVVWCRLVLAHVANLGLAYRELARVSASAGTVIVSDFHPMARARGHQRTFRDSATVIGIQDHAHSLAEHRAAASAARLRLVEEKTGVVGPAIRDFYADAGRLGDYRMDFGLPLVFALRFERS